MASTRQIGRKKERRTRDWLEELGYKVCLTPMPTRWQKEQDMFGLWDLIAVDSDQVRFIQVKSRKIYGKELIKYNEFPCPPNCTKEVWVWKRGARAPFIQILED